MSMAEIERLRGDVDSLIARLAAMTGALNRSSACIERLTAQLAAADAVVGAARSYLEDEDDAAETIEQLWRALQDYEDAVHGEVKR